MKGFFAKLYSYRVRTYTGRAQQTVAIIIIRIDSTLLDIVSTTALRGLRVSTIGNTVFDNKLGCQATNSYLP